MKVGRIDLSPCASEKKYKKCCLNWRENWGKFIENYECDQDVKDIVKSSYDFILDFDFQGGCHLVSAIMYMLLKEKGYNPLIRIGEVEAEGVKFDHSWIEFTTLVIDVTIVNTLQQEFKLPPVMFGDSASSGESHKYRYGITERLDYEAQIVYEQSVGDYVMAGVEHQSLFIMREIAKKSGIEIDNIEELVSRYSNDYRILATC